jgi:hypothetical protein
MHTAQGRTPSLSILFGSCALVLTGAYLGMSWLRTPVLGIPVGLWLIATVQVQTWLMRRSLGQLRIVPSEQGAAGVFGKYVGRSLAAAWECGRAMARSLRVPRDWFTGFEDKLTIRVGSGLPTSETLRIGLDAGPEVRDAITSQPTEVEVEWVTLSPGADDQATLRRHRLDALVRTPSGGGTPAMRIVTLEHPEREAGWYDWSTQRPLTYASVFPVRVDPTQVTLDAVDVSNAAESALVASLVRSAAALSRTPGRLRLSDRLVGRGPSTTSEAGVRTPTSLLDRAMLELAGRVIEHGRPGSRASLAAARAVGAWLASTEAWLDITFRRKGVEAAAAILPTECEAHLRAAAVRLAMFDDDAAFAALREAGRIIRAGSHQHVGEHLAFLQAELELGSPNPLTLGRVGAGICLVCASTTPDRAAFIRGDLMDDVRHSAWLVGRDQDRQLLGEIFTLMGADRVTPGPWELRDAA